MIIFSHQLAFFSVCIFSCPTNVIRMILKSAHLTPRFILLAISLRKIEAAAGECPAVMERVYHRNAGFLQKEKELMVIDAVLLHIV